MNEEWIAHAEALTRAAEELDGIAEDYESHGNNSQAASASCRAYELRQVLSHVVRAHLQHLPMTGREELSDAQLQALWDEACQDGPGKPGWSRHLRFARSVLSAAPSTDKEGGEGASGAQECGTCSGYGRVLGTGDTPCKDCGGTGKDGVAPCPFRGSCEVSGEFFDRGGGGPFKCRCMPVPPDLETTAPQPLSETDKSVYRSIADGYGVALPQTTDPKGGA